MVSGKISLMDDFTQKFTIRLTDRGLVIQGRDGARLAFNPVEALMLLDILKNEESALKQMAQEASPLPMRVRFKSSSDE
jgi:hypothetical protein